jgi:predicted dehydrogenase
VADRILKVGIIGIGFYALTQHVPRLRETGKAELVAIARRSAEALAFAQQATGAAGAYTDWRELLDHPGLDAVIVTTPHHAHAAPALAALERGLDVLVEKPMALRSEDAWKMVRAAERTERVLMVGYDRRCEGLWRTVAGALQSGALGTVRQVSVSFAHNFRWLWEAEEWPPPIRNMVAAAGLPESFGGSLQQHWRRDPAKMGGGVFAGPGSHFVDLALWLGGAPPVEAVALSASTGGPVETHVGVQARLANDVLLSLSSADGVPAGANRIVVYGDGRTLTADWNEGQVPEIVLHVPGKHEHLEADMPDTTPAAAFVETVLHNAPNLSPGRDSAYEVALVEAAYRSAAERRVVEVNLG